MMTTVTFLQFGKLLLNVMRGATFQLIHQKHLYSTKADTRYANERGLYSQLRSGYAHSLSRKSESANLDIAAEYLILTHGNDISLSKPSEHSNDLLYVNCDEIHPYSKGKNFIETESNRNKLRGFNL